MRCMPRAAGRASTAYGRGTHAVRVFALHIAPPSPATLTAPSNSPASTLAPLSPWLSPWLCPFAAASRSRAVAKRPPQSPAARISCTTAAEMQGRGVMGCDAQQQ